jgi:chemotaxis protein methyltransferase WspC
MIQIEQILREKIGLDPASIGPSSIHRTVRGRMKALGIATTNEYTRLISQFGPEWTELVEAIVVTETWFFRDRGPFEAFVRLASERLLGTSDMARTRILSAPCSSGEEPYSLAMALRDAGLPLEKFQIDAADLSSRALGRAKRGVYRRNSFRGHDLVFRGRYFRHGREGYVLDPVIRGAVRFFEDNILSPDFLRGQGPYDFIFCRNLLIYCDSETRTRALETISRLLSPTGILVVGAAEQALMLENRFISANVAMAFVKAKPSMPGEPHSVPGPRPTRAFRSLPLQPVPSALTSPARTVGLSEHRSRFDFTSPSSRPVLPPRYHLAPFNALAAVTGDLANVRRAADAGRLHEAASLCETHLKLNPASAEAWYLLGLIREGSADASADECYRKALYLDPTHYETLLQMAFLSEQSGNTARARTFKNRALRTRNLSPLTSEPVRA